MGIISGPSFLGFNDLYVSDTTIPSGYSLGMLAFGTGGEMYRYALAGASNLVKGNLIQERATDTQFNSMAVLAASVVTTGVPQTVTITNGTTVINAHDFDGGAAVVSTTPDGGSSYTVTGHGTDAVGSANVLFTLDRPLIAAWTTSTKVDLRWNAWSKVIQIPATTPTGMAVGIANFALVATDYGWVQTHGVVAALSDGSTFVAGDDLGTGSGTAGCVTVYAAGTGHQHIGYARHANNSGHWINAFLTID